jgi:hypothetical protein
MSAELILNLINEVLDEKQLLPEEEAKTPEKLPPIKFPTLKFTERGIGKPGSEDRKMFERLMSGVKGGTVKEKLASIKEFIDISPTKDIKEILSKLMFIELFSQLLNEFNPSTAGFLFEAFLSGLFEGTQIDDPVGGSLPIQDVEIKQAAKEFVDGARDDEEIVVAFSLKVLSPTVPVKGSYKNTVDYFVNQFKEGNKNPFIVYLVVVKEEGTGELGKLKFYQFAITKDNWLDWIGAPKITTRKEAVFQYVKGNLKNDRTIKQRNVGKVFKALKNAEGDDPEPIPFKVGETVPKGTEVIEKVKAGEKEIETVNQTAVSKKLYGTEQEAEDVKQIGGGTTPFGFFEYLKRTPGYKNNEQWKIPASVYPKKAKLIGELDLSQEKRDELMDVYSQRLGAGVVNIYNRMADLTKNIQSYFIPADEQERMKFGGLAIDDATNLKSATDEVIGSDISARQQELPLQKESKEFDDQLQLLMKEVFGK